MLPESRFLVIQSQEITAEADLLIRAARAQRDLSRSLIAETQTIVERCRAKAQNRRP